MLHKYTSLIILMIQYDFVPKAAGGAHELLLHKKKKLLILKKNPFL